jgi:P-type Ca2+ transporter type 2C
MSTTLAELTRRGLSQTEAARRLGKHGPNALPEGKGITLWQSFARQFQSALIYILLFALALDLALWLHEGAKAVPYEAIAIALILLINAGLGTYQEGKAEEALARLKALAMPSAWVIRDGTLAPTPVDELVPGDVVRIEAGDRVPADGVLTAGHGLMVDESILTGESLPVDKTPDAELFSGTLVVRSQGYMGVTHTGPSSTMGRLALMLGGIDAGQTPLERRLREFGNQVAIAILAVGIALIIGGLVVEGTGRLGQVVLFSVALAVAAVPEGLPAVLTLTLAMGVERLAKRKAIVRRLNAVEALGSITVIVTDKTGTLTENRMHVRAIDAPDPDRALHAMVLANDAEIGTGAGDPLKVALLNYAASRGANPEAVAANKPRLSSQPFDSVTRFMRVTVQEGGKKVSYLKGAPEVLIDRSALSDTQKREWETKALQHAGEGYRVLALGWREEEGEDDIRFLGLVMLWDPPRPAGGSQACAGGRHSCRHDHGGSPGNSQGRRRGNRHCDGARGHRSRDRADDCRAGAQHRPERQRLCACHARAQAAAGRGPEGQWRDRRGHGRRGQRRTGPQTLGCRGDVSREVADIVLLDYNFATIVAAIEEGRSIYENIQKFIRFFFSTDLALIALMTGGLGMAFLLGLKDPTGGTFLLPLTAVQLLWINVIADGPPALALAFDRNPGVMSKPPRPPRSKLLDQASLRFIVVSGASKAIGGLAVLGAMPLLGYSLDEARTSLFLYESVLQLVFTYPSRRVYSTPLPNVWLHLAVASGIALQLLTVLLVSLRTLLGLVPLSAGVLAAILIAAVLTWGLAELASRLAQAAHFPS